MYSIQEIIDYHAQLIRDNLRRIEGSRTPEMLQESIVRIEAILIGTKKLQAQWAEEVFEKDSLCGQK